MRVSTDITSVRKLLESDPLAAGDAALRYRRGLQRFSQYLPLGADEIWARALSRFVDLKPWRYWDENTVNEALATLETSVERTAEAITCWTRQIGTGIDSLFKTSGAADREEALDITKPRDLLRLATEFHPDYLRCAEHAFSNLLTIYWAVLKKGSAAGKYDLRGAVSLVNGKHRNLLIGGYDDRVRNAIAHGEIVFRGEGLIQYGPDSANYVLAPYEFLSRYDELCRTSNALAIALLLFVARNEYSLPSYSGFKMPVQIPVFVAAAGVERSGLRVSGAIESNTPRGGKRLHVSLESTFRSRIQVLSDCARLSMYLLDHGASDYLRYVFDVNLGQAVSSLVMVKLDQLAELLRKDAPLASLSQAFDENVLLWYDEGKVRYLLRAWGAIATSRYRLFRADFAREMALAGFRRAANTYRIRKIENASAGGIRRIKVTAVLQDPSDANDRQRIKEIIKAVLEKVSNVSVRTDPSGLEKRWSTFGSASYIWISLYKVDGSLRWLGGGGWQSGNLLAVAEKVRKRKLQPVLVPKPEEIWCGIRLQFTMDVEAYSEAMNNLAQLIEQID